MTCNTCKAYEARTGLCKKHPAGIGNQYPRIAHPERGCKEHEAVAPAPKPEPAPLDHNSFKEYKPTLKPKNKRSKK